MRKKLLWRFILIGLSSVLAIIFLLPNTPIFQHLPKWWKELTPEGISLGLDLQGGLHLVFEVEGDKAIVISTERYASVLKDISSKKKIDVDIKTEGIDIIVGPANDVIKNFIKENYPILKQVEEGSRLVYRLSDREAKKIKDNAADQALETIRNRIDQFGVAEPTIVRQGENEIVIQLPGVKNPRRAVELIGKTAQLEFKLVDDDADVAAQLPESIEAGGEDSLLKQFSDKIPADDEILFLKKINRETGVVTKQPILLKKKSELTGDLLSEARVSIDTRYNEPYVSLSFNDAGAKIFEDVTAANINKRLAIILDNTVYSAPVIREKISGGDAQISGNFSEEEAMDLSIVLRAGALPAPLKMLQNVTVGPSLGKDSIEAGKIAGIIGTLAVVIFMILYYRLSGLIADIALVFNILLLLGVMAWLNATLTLPGIAGIILAVGMAVDTNVLMFERMREELKAGKTPRAAVDSGYSKAFMTIVDSHVTTLITAIILFQFGTGPIKGFAVTLGLGVAINLFTALIGTKAVFDLINSKREVKTLSI